MQLQLVWVNVGLQRFRGDTIKVQLWQFAGGGGGGGGDNPPSLSSGCPVTVATQGGEGRHLTLGGGRRTEPWSFEDGRGEGGPPPTASAGKIRAVKLAV